MRRILAFLTESSAYLETTSQYGRHIRIPLVHFSVCLLKFREATFPSEVSMNGIGEASRLPLSLGRRQKDGRGRTDYDRREREAQEV